VFVLCFLLNLLAYQGLRFLFLFWNANFYFQQPISDLFVAFFHGLRFDLSATAILSLIPFLVSVVMAIFYKKRPWAWMLFATAGIFWLFQFPFVILNYVDVEFVNFLGRRYTVDALIFAQEAQGKVWQILGFYWKLASINLVTFIFTTYFIAYFVPQKVRGIQLQMTWKKLTISSLLIFFTLAVSARGGLQSKPINFAHSQIFLNPAMNNLVLNSTFTVIQTVLRKPLAREKFFSDQEMLQWMKAGVSGPSQLATHPLSQKPNIVVIMLESFALEYTGAGGYTPFLDELAAKGISFKNAFANARRSIEGMGAILGGVPALMNEPFISSQYMTNYFQGLGSELAKKKYDSGFFHGAQNETMYFNQFMKSAGVKKYFGLNEFPDKSLYDGTWGIWDEPFLQWTADQLDGFQTPFFGLIFTLTSHNPFKVPEQYAGQFPKGNLEIHESIGYTDYALRKFFETAAQKSWFDNTIFILTADHTYKAAKPDFQNELGNYRVPLIIYSPKIQLPTINTEQVVQHIDIFPTILDLVGIKIDKSNLMGRSVFVPGDRTAISFIDNRYLFIAKDYFLQYHPGSEPQMFSRLDPNASKPLIEPIARKDELVHRMKAQIQYFSQGLWDNKLYYPSHQE
jgi:phosphoglycerol transferase MdoB-like AlkP superfamily enzyme